MVQEIPEWLNEQFLSTALREEVKNGIPTNVTSFQVAPVVPAGNNYGSNILRVKICCDGTSGDQHLLSVILKYPLAGDMKADLLQQLQEVEPIFYNKFYPQAHLITDFTLVPKIYHSCIPSVILMEDLSEQGYKMADRCKLLDLDHSRLYAIAAASLHAISVVVGKEDPEMITVMGAEKLFTDGPIGKLYEIGIKQGLECLAEQMEKSEHVRYSKVVREAASYLWHDICEAHKPSGSFNCLNQGDPWTTNMMFKYNESGKVTDIKLLDFQALRYGSPMNDIVFFLWTSADHDVRENRLDEFLHIYCDTLSGKLSEMGCSKGFTYEDALEGLKILRPASLMFAVATFPLLVQPGGIDFSALTSDKNGLAKIYDEGYCQRHVPRILKQLNALGVFSYLENH